MPRRAAPYKGGHRSAVLTCLAPWVAAVVLGASPAPVQGQALQGHRAFPALALRGELQVISATDVLLNGRAERLAPGARIRGENNLLVMTGAIIGQRLTVHYQREISSGQLLNLWILNPVERSNRPWPSTEQEARAWSFEPSSQTWKRP